MHVGWDWAGEAHDITIVDDTGAVIDRWALTHDEEGIAGSICRLASHGDPDDLPIAIEATHSLVIDRLLAGGHPVVPIHPNAFHATRPRWGASKAKSDPGDSYKLADYLRTEGHRLRRLRPLSAEAAQLQALVRMRDDHVAAKVAATNQLNALLARHWPGATTVFARLDSDIALAFLDDYPTPASAVRLGEGRMAMFCRRHSYCGRRRPGELLDRLRSAPEPTEAINAETLNELVRAQVRVLRTILGTIADLDRSIGAALLEHPKARLLAPMPRIGEINLAQIVAEVGPILDRAIDVEHACAEVGADPGHSSVGQERERELPLGRQHRRPPSAHDLRRQQPPQLALGRSALPRRPSTRQTTPPRHPHPRPLLDARHLGLLAHQHRLRRHPPRGCWWARRAGGGCVCRRRAPQDASFVFSPPDSVPASWSALSARSPNVPRRVRRNWSSGVGVLADVVEDRLAGADAFVLLGVVAERRVVAGPRLAGVGYVPPRSSGGVWSCRRR